MAGPAWQTYTVMVLFDCRRYNDCVFAQAVPRSLSRESLLHAAGLPPNEPVNVFVHGLIQPLALDQRITLVHGMTVSITPRSEGGPAHADLADMLLTAEGWDKDAPLPGPDVHFNSHFYILTEGMPFAFHVRPGRQATFREDIAQATGTAEHRLSLGTVTPRIVDAYPFGYWTSAVLVATDALSRVPCPPARVPEQRSILVLDQRRILRGIAWRFVRSRVLKVQDLADLYYDMCPFRHVVSLDGARIEVRDGVQVFVIQPGQVLTIEFVPEKQSPSSSGNGHGPTGILGGEESPSGPQTPVHSSVVQRGNSTRSRSPRGQQPHEAGRQTGPNHAPIDKFAGVFSVKPCLGPWRQGGKHAASKGIDVADWQCLDVHVAHTTVENFLALAGTSFASTCKLLDEPNADATHTSALASARDATRLLGGEWPFPPYRWPIELPALDDDAMLDVMVGEGVMTDIVLFLLTPDYSHERLDLTVELPQTVADVVDLAQTCRDASRKRLYPNLVELHQQPDPGWGIFLAVPSWLRHQAVVCIDSSLFDGRVFAISISSNTDRYVLCTSAGLAPTAEVDIYVPGHAGPLPLGADCQMATGMCVVFVRPGRARPASFQLSETLRSRLFWEHSPVFPQDSLGNGYCIAGPTGQVLFRLHPERAFFYRADIALLADLHPLRAVVTPAEPQQLDVSVRGWLCRTVVAATDRDDQTLWDGTVTSAIPGLLDCRPLLMGWLPVSSRARWLDLEPIRLALNQSAPPGWRICFPDLPAHWTWVCFHEGTVVRVALEEHNDHMPAAVGIVRGSLTHSPGHEGNGSGNVKDCPAPVACPAVAVAATRTRSGVSCRQPRPIKQQIPKSWHTVVTMCVAGAISLALSCCDMNVGIVACAMILSSHPLPSVICLADQFAPAEGMQAFASRSSPLQPSWTRRPLPTPARSGLAAAHNDKERKNLGCHLPAPNELHTGDRKTLSDELVNLATLLEDSLASPASEAFFLAATLLETLLEHYGGFFEDSTAAVHQPSRPISVFDSVPPPLFSLDVDSVQMPHSQDLIRKMYQPWPADWILAGKLIESQLPATTKQGLARLVPASDLFCERQSAQLSFSLYTDGSASQAKGQSGYATIILGHVDSNTAFLGALGDQISGRPDSPWNPEGPLALHAEHIAIAAAVLWAMQMRGTLSVVCCSLFFDCTAAGWSAEGSWQTSGPTSAFVHNLYMAARATPGIHLEFHHVRGHSNDPWNDLADHVAKSAASNTCDWPRPPSALCSLLTAQDISWLAPELDARVHHAVPIFDGALSWNGSRVIGPLLAPAQLVPTTGSAADDAEESSWFSIKAATINIQSLRGKCKYVEDQLDARSIHVAFLQETKLPGGTLTSAHYLRLHTDADSHWGVGIWVHRRLGVISMDGKALKVEESDFTILHEAPRLLVVVLNVGDLKIGLVSGHCPHATRQQERDDFLATLGSLMQRLKHTNLTFGGIDLNGRPPMNFAGVTGDLEFGEPDATGWGLVQILADAGMWIPSTYTQLHCGDSTTYVHPCGQPHRIDYILVGGRALVTDTRSEPDETFDNGSPQEDHTLLCLHLKGSTAVRYGQRKLLRPVYDREKILSPEGRALVREALAAFPHPSWHTHPDQHCVQIEEFLQEKLDLHFAQPPQQRRASYIPDNVWQQRDAKLHFKYRAQGASMERSGVPLFLSMAHLSGFWRWFAVGKTTPFL